MADGLSKPIHPFASPILVLLSYLRATSVHAASTATAGGQPPKLKVAGERSPSDSTLGIRENVWYYYRSSLALLARQYVKVKQGKLSLWEMVQVAAICGLLPALWLLTSKAHRGGEGTRDSIQSLWPSKGTERPSSSASRTKFSFAAKGSSDATDTDPSLLRKHSQIRSYTTPIHGVTYQSIRVFHHPHPQAAKLPSKPSPLPLLVFVHGLGGSLAQFHPLLTSLVNLAPCLGIDLPGCGRSSFAPTSWDAYTTKALVELLATVIEDYRDKDVGQSIVLIGHSMGCSLAALLGSSTSSHPSKLSHHVSGFVAVCPKATPPSEKEIQMIKYVLRIPTPLFDLWRRWDRRGGIDSPSVARFVGQNADSETRKLQVRFNEQSKTAVWRRMVWGLLPANGLTTGGLAGREDWAGLDMPTFFIAGEEDAVTKPEELEVIVGFMGRGGSSASEKASELSQSVPDAAAPVDTSTLSGPGHTKTKQLTSEGIEISGYQENQPSSLDSSSASENNPRRILRTTILPSPAAHALLYAPASSRILAGLISDFMAAYISPRLSFGWQLQYLSTEGKWDVKNLAKWQAIAPVSQPIGDTFRAMKTLREVDDKHRPEIFVKEWVGRISDVIDISHETPVYDPRGLEKGGIRYHKFPTVSKLPPTVEEVRDFIELVDSLRSKQGDPAMDPARAVTTSSDTNEMDSPVIGVHCHYGFNRTGFLIVCYLIEQRNYKVQTAIDEFARQRPPGIRHDHFIDTLFVRYCVGLKRAPTF